MGIHTGGMEWNTVSTIKKQCNEQLRGKVSIGFKGPIGKDKLVAFAISRAIVIPPEGERKSNAGLAKCKICGAPMEKGHGNPVDIIEPSAGRFRRYFACKECVALVVEANKIWESGDDD